MKNNLLIFTFSFLAFPALGWAQSAPDFKELLDSAMVRDSNLKMQITQNKLTDLDEHKLKDIFLPTLELSGKAGYLNGTARLTSPEINLAPFINIPEGAFNNNFNVSGFSGIAKADAKMLLYSGGKVKYLKKAVEESLKIFCWRRLRMR